MYSFLFSHRSSRSPLVLFFFQPLFLIISSCTHNSLFRTFLHRTFLFFSFFPFTLQRVQHVQSPIYIMYTSFRDFSNDNVSRSLSHTLPLPFRTQQILKPVRFLFPFSFFQYGPPVTPVTLSMQEKKNERRKNKTKEREKNKKKKNGTTQLRKFVNRLPIRPGTNALEIVPVYLARSTPSHISPFVSFDYKSNGWNVAAFTIHYPVVVLVPWARPFARTKFIESINSVARRTEAQDSRRDDTRKETKIYCNGLCDPRVRSELNETKF